MEIVFVRHGQTAANAAHRHQVPEEPLTPRGIEQVRALIPELEAWQTTHIIASPLARAQHTATILSTALDVPVSVQDEFRELRRPLHLFGRRHLGFASLWYMTRWFFRSFIHRNNVTEGESYPAFRRRLERARSKLEQYPADARIVVVSHSVFINLFTAHACDMHRLSSWRAALFFLHILTLKNARTTYLTYSPSDEQTCSWQRVSPPPSTT